LQEGCGVFAEEVQDAGGVVFHGVGRGGGEVGRAVEGVVVGKWRELGADLAGIGVHRDPHGKLGELLPDGLVIGIFRHGAGRDDARARAGRVAEIEGDGMG
jgi:hypothetical protein